MGTPRITSTKMVEMALQTRLFSTLSRPKIRPRIQAKNRPHSAYWQPTPKADGYYVRNFKVLTLPEAQESVLLEEDFSKVTDGTLSAPVGLYNISVGLLDKYDLTQQPGWMGLCNYKANGMLGGFGSFFGKGLLQTPTMKLDGNNGKFKVEIIAYGVIGSMATVDSALFSSSSTTRVIKMMVLSLLHISLNRALAKLRVWLKHSAHRPIPISKATPHNSRLTA